MFAWLPAVRQPRTDSLQKLSHCPFQPSDSVSSSVRVFSIQSINNSPSHSPHRSRCPAQHYAVTNLGSGRRCPFLCHSRRNITPFDPREQSNRQQLPATVRQFLHMRCGHSTRGAKHAIVPFPKQFGERKPRRRFHNSRFTWFGHIVARLHPSQSVRRQFESAVVADGGAPIVTVPGSDHLQKLFLTE